MKILDKIWPWSRIKWLEKEQKFAYNKWWEGQDDKYELKKENRKLKKENEKLRKRIIILKGQKKLNDDAAMLYFKAEKENESLKRELEECKNLECSWLDNPKNCNGPVR